MGLFDTIVDYGLRCPHCGYVMGEFQTKDGPCWMGTYDVHREKDCFECDVRAPSPFSEGRTSHTNFKGLETVTGIAWCRSEVCRFYDIVYGIVKWGVASSGSRHFDVVYNVDEEGRVVAPCISITDTEPPIPIKALFEQFEHLTKHIPELGGAVSDAMAKHPIYPLCLFELDWSTRICENEFFKKFREERDGRRD